MMTYHRNTIYISKDHEEGKNDFLIPGVFTAGFDVSQGRTMKNYMKNHGNSLRSLGRVFGLARNYTRSLEPGSP